MYRLVFEEREKTRVPEEKPLGVKERAKNKLSPRVASDICVVTKLETKKSRLSLYYGLNESFSSLTIMHILRKS